MQIAVKEHFADDARLDIDYFVRRHLAAIADSIDAPRGTLVVFNPLNWQRSSLVEYDLRKGTALLDLTTKKEVPYEVLSRSDQATCAFASWRGCAARGLQVLCPRCRHGGTFTPIALPVKCWRTPTIASRWIPRVARFKASSTKQMNEELVNTSSPYRFDQYLYVTGGDTVS